MQKSPEAAPRKTDPLSLDAVAEEFALLGEYFKNRVLTRANQVDKGRAEITALKAELATLKTSKASQ